MRKQTDTRSKDMTITAGLGIIMALSAAYNAPLAAAERLKIARVVHGSATPIVLKNDAYRQRHQTDNPNTELI